MGDRVPSLTSRTFRAALAASAFALLLLVPAARSDTTAISWTPPTPKNHTKFTVSVGSTVTFTLTAATTLPDAAVHIEPHGLPVGVSFNSSDGGAARATVTWTPEKPGDHTVRFSASTIDPNGAHEAAPTRTYVIHVVPGDKPATVKYPHRAVLTTLKTAHWAAVLKRAVVRAQPKTTARVVTTLSTKTSDGTQNLVLVLEELDLSPTQTWYHVRLPILPNNSTGWVLAAHLGPLYAVNTHLYVDRATMTATLKRNGVTIFKTIVGVGKPYWPTPRGQFYIRDKLTNFHDPFYGPVAFGTSARSAVLTDWPGGGFVGVHGTNQPQILPGRVSHGCIRMRNPAILKLARLMPVGTPLTVT
jgi:hypothetical protein